MNGQICLFAFLLFTENNSNSSVCFLGESRARQSAFLFYLIFRWSGFSVHSLQFLHFVLPWYECFKKKIFFTSIFSQRSLKKVKNLFTHPSKETIFHQKLEFLFSRTPSHPLMISRVLKVWWKETTVGLKWKIIPQKSQKTFVSVSKVSSNSK